MLIKKLKGTLMVAMLASIATVAFADDVAAPVYDINNSSTPSTTQDLSGSTQPVSPPLTAEQRIARLEQQISNLQHSDSSAKVNDLQNEVQTFRGQVDELTHQIQTLQNQQKAMYSDLDKRINSKVATTKTVLLSATVDDDKATSQRAEAGTSPVKSTSSSTRSTNVSSPKVNTSQPNVAEEQQVYQTAYNLIKAKKFNEAVTVLQKMLQKYPSGQFAGNAHYWLGELYGLMGKNDESTQEFVSVLKNYPDNAKVADAQLKLGLIYAAQFKWQDAKSSFKTVINRYPGTAYARLASEQLKQLKQAGH